MDHDGVLTSIENAGPNSGDANFNGILDGNEEDVATYISPVNSGYVTLIATGGCRVINGVNNIFESQNTAQDPLNDYMIGMHSFQLLCTASGQSATITYVWDKLYDTSLWTDYEKYNPNTNTYSSISGLVTYGVSYGKTSVTYSITDGGPLDTDGLVNSTIEDPAGPVIINRPVITSPNSGSTIFSTLINIIGTGTIGSVITLANTLGTIL